MSVLQAIDEYLGVSGMAASRFGREAVGDPRLVFDMRKGRKPRAPLIARITAILGRDAQ
jgi:hypothetical protein